MEMKICPYQSADFRGQKPLVKKLSQFMGHASHVRPIESDSHDLDQLLIQELNDVISLRREAFGWFDMPKALSDYQDTFSLQTVIHPDWTLANAIQGGA